MSDLNQPAADADADLGEVDPVESTEERLRQDAGAPPPPIDADEADARRGAAVWGGGAAG